MAIPRYDQIFPIDKETTVLASWLATYGPCTMLYLIWRDCRDRVWVRYTCDDETSDLDLIRPDASVERLIETSRSWVADFQARFMEGARQAFGPAARQMEVFELLGPVTWQTWTAWLMTTGKFEIRSRPEYRRPQIGG
jgi:hypothetical protein